MPIIIIIIIAMYITLISWVWQSLGKIDKTKKVIVIALGIFIVFLLTLIIFNISKAEINYQNYDRQKTVRNILVSVFTGLNSLILIPYISKLLNKVYENEIEKEAFSKRVVILLIIFLICTFFECGYLKDTQEGILKIYNSSNQKGY